MPDLIIGVTVRGRNDLTAERSIVVTQQAGPAVWPNADTTGVRPGVTLAASRGTFTVTQNGVVIVGQQFTDMLRIEADNVTVRDCRIVCEGANHGILIPDGRKGSVVEYCDIIGPINGISGAGTFRFNDLARCNNGVNVFGPSLIEGNYIHDFAGGSDAHYDGVEMNGGGGTTIRGNNIVNEHNQTSAVMINNYFGGVNNILVENNRLVGGGYTIYTDGRFTNTPMNNICIINNRLGKGRWGYSAYWETTTNSIWSGNVDDKTGQIVRG
jgi:hypothetical protein